MTTILKVLGVILVVVLAVIGLVVALLLSLAAFPKWQVRVLVGEVAALLFLIFVYVWQVPNLQAEDTQERREQAEPGPPRYPRYEASISVVTLFFAAVLGFGLNNLLDQDKWLLFLVATLIFLRLLTASANHLWLEHLMYERPYQPREDIPVIFGFSCLTVFGCLGAYICYADDPSQFFSRATYLLYATLAASMIQVLWALFNSLFRSTTWTPPIGQWIWVWFVANTYQLTAVLILMDGSLRWTWDARLLALAIVSAVILFFDFRWQLSQLARKPVQRVAAARADPQTRQKA